MNKSDKILVVSHFSTNPEIYTYASSFVGALRTLGHDVATFNTKAVCLPGLTSVAYHKLPSILRLINNRICNEQLIAAVEQLQPDILFFIKAESITPKTLTDIKKLCNPMTISFYPDNPFTFWNGNANSNTLTALPRFEHVLSWSHMLKPALQSAGARMVHYFPFGYDAALFNQPIAISDQDQQKYAADVCFVGTWEAEREQQLTELVRHNPSLDLALWGNLWALNVSDQSPLKPYIRGSAICGSEMIKAFRCSKIVLNFIRQQNMTSHNMRTIEVPASNAFLLTERTYEQAELLFQEDVHLACFGSTQELREKIAFYLKEDSLRRAITAQGHSHVQQFSLSRQLEQLFDIIKSKLSHKESL